MEQTLQGHPWVKKYISGGVLASGLLWGLLGGLIGTLVMDLVLLGALSAVGVPPFTCFTIIGNTISRLYSTMGVQIAGSTIQGVAAHYLLGPALGAIFGAATVKIKVLRSAMPRSAIVLAVLYVEILSQPILAMPPILLQYTTPETLRWFSLSFIMHLIWGVILGMVVRHGYQRLSLYLA